MSEAADANEGAGDRNAAENAELARELARVRARVNELEQIIEAAPDPVWCKDTSGAWTLINSAAAATLGHPAGTILGRRDRDILPEAAARRIEAEDARIMAGETVSADETMHDARTGGERAFASVKSPLIGPDGAITGLIGISRDITERKRAETAMKERADELQTIIDAVPAAICVAHDAAFGRVTFNRYAAELLGVRQDVSPPGAATGLGKLGVRAMRDGEDVPVAALPMRRAAAGEVVDEDEMVLRLTDGRDIVLLGNAHPLLGADGDVRGAIYAGIDITSRRAAENALARSEAQFRATADALPGLLFVSDAAGENIYVNEGFRSFTGLSEEALMGSGWLVVIHPDDAQNVERVWRDAIAGRSLYEVEYRARRHDGAWRWHIARGVPSRGPDGAIERWVGACIDIHDRKRLEEQMNSLNAELAGKLADRTVERDRAWNVNRDLVIVLDDHGVVHLANPAWETMLGYRPEAIVGRDFRDFVIEDDRAESTAALAVATREPLLGFENRYRAADGSERNISWATAPEGNLIFASGRDVTQERAREAELAAAREDVAQFQKIETLGQLTGGVAHDFNNLLTPIIGGLDLLGRREGLADRDRRLIQGALQSAERARLLVQRLLAFARRQQLEARPVDLEGLLHGLRDLIERSIGPRIRVEIAATTNLPPALVDANQLELAILNLALNARDAMPEGGTLTLRARRSVPREEHGLVPGRYVILSVADTGTGMDAQTQRRAIEPFFSTKGVGKGTGLGLSMVHGLAAQSDGKLEVASAPGAGTTILLWLPATEPADDTMCPSPHVAGMVRLRILVVDDEPLVRATIVEMLEDQGHQVDAVPSAAAALAHIAQGPTPDLVLTDYLMPEMTGAALARRLLDQHPGLPVVIVTGFARLDDPALTGLRTLAKPFSPGDLARTVALAA
jgi:PAS domain S-box-containing protein